RTQFTQRGAERENARYRRIAAVAEFNVDLAFIDGDADIFGGAVEAPIIPAAFLVDLALIDVLLREDAVRNAENFDLELRDVDGLDGDAVGLRARQDYAAAGETDIGRPVAEREREGLFVFSPLAGLRRQSF